MKIIVAAATVFEGDEAMFWVSRVPSGSARRLTTVARARPDQRSAAEMDDPPIPSRAFWVTSFGRGQDGVWETCHRCRICFEPPRNQAPSSSPHGVVVATPRASGLSHELFANFLPFRQGDPPENVTSSRSLFLPRKPVSSLPSLPSSREMCLELRFR